LKRTNKLQYRALQNLLTLEPEDDGSTFLWNLNASHSRISKQPPWWRSAAL